MGSQFLKITSNPDNSYKTINNLQVEVISFILTTIPLSIFITFAAPQKGTIYPLAVLLWTYNLICPFFTGYNISKFTHLVGCTLCLFMTK